MNTLKLDLSKISNFLGDNTIESFKELASSSNSLLHSGKGAGSDFLGWVNLPSSITSQAIEELKQTAAKLRENSEIVIVAGIGGSYLGAKAVIEALGNSFAYLHKNKTEPTVIFAGQNISEDYVSELLDGVKDYSISCVIISKSGTTTEPAIAFRILKKEIEARYGIEGARERIVAVTDSSRGALKTLSDEMGYKTFVIPDDVGGRFSVLTPVGLLPLAVAGVDIEALVKGASDMQAATGEGIAFEDNISAQYAVARNILYNNGYKTEILASYEPKMQYVAEWWKQLYGESEGKDNKGIFPASVTLTADLHSMGQYIQEGERTLFETLVSIAEPASCVKLEPTNDNLDGLNFLSGKRLSEINAMAELGTMLAHVDGGVPNIRVEMAKIDAYNIGQLIYFFEKACGISGYILGVNPFDQPGVEQYKKNMFALLEKPGYEAETEAIKARLK
ncbi:MAG: glucose-6-phosphate isomerase [Rikenellaceae bacterium]